MFTCQIIPVDRIHSPQRWDLRPFLAANAAAFQSPDSITIAGLLYLPLVRPTGEGLYELITGGRCLAYARTTWNIGETVCRVLNRGMSDGEILRLLYGEYSRQARPTRIEQAHFMRICQTLLDEGAWRRLAAELQIEASPYGVARLLELLSLEPCIQEWLWDGRLAESMAREMLRLSSEDRVKIFALFARFSLGGNKQKRLLSLLADLAGRSGQSVGDYLQDRDIQAILSQPHLNGPQQFQLLLQLLQERHSPSMASAEKFFKAWVNNLQLPENFHVEHSKSFERDEVALAIQFQNKEELVDFIDRIRLVLQPNTIK